MHNRASLSIISTFALVVLGVGACGTQRRGVTTVASPAVVPLSSPGGVVHLQTAAGIETFGVNGGNWTAKLAVASPDWSTIFIATAGRLRTLDGVTGAERASQTVAAGLRPTVSSADGRLVALTDSPSRVGEGILPVGRSHSTIVVAPADPSGGPSRTLVIDGNVVPEGFSTDRSRLYVIDFLPALHPDRYRVRAVDIATGQIGPVFTFDKTVDSEEMRGLSRTQVFSAAGPYGSMLYTLYTRADGGYADVHALALDGGLVHCTDLPASLHITPAGGAIAVSPDGHHVYVASPTGSVAEIDTSGSSQQLFAIAHSTQLAAGPGTTTVAVTADDHTVWVGLGTRLVGLDPNDLHTVTTTTVDQPIHALAIDASGALYAATDNAVESVRPATGATHQLGTIDSPPRRLAVV